MTAEACIEWARHYARRRLNSLLADEHRCLPPNVFLDFGRRGLLGLTAPEQDGGCGLKAGDALRVLHQISIIDVSLGNAIGMHNFLGGKVLLAHLQPEVRDRWKADIASGRLLAAFALTELEAGSDPRRMTTVAHRLADGTWLLNGHKAWCGLAAWSGISAVFAQGFDEGGRRLGITGFAVPLDLSGVSQGPESVTMGLRSVVQNQLNFEDVSLGPEYVLGLPGQGMEVAQTGMMTGRIAMTLFANAAALRALQLARQYVSERKIAGGLMAENPVVSDRISKESARTQSVHLFLEYCFDIFDRDDEPSMLVCLASKIVGPEQSWMTLDTCLQLLGARGYTEPNGMARIYRDARVIRIFEGPTEAMTAYLGAWTAVKSDEVKELLVGSLNAADLWEHLKPFTEPVSPRSPLRQSLSRPEVLRLEFDLGTRTAHAIFLAVVRCQAGGSNPDRLAVRLMEEVYAEVATQCPRRAEWCFKEGAAELAELLEGLVGDVSETKGAEKWQPDDF